MILQPPPAALIAYALARKPARRADAAELGARPAWLSGPSAISGRLSAALALDLPALDDIAAALDALPNQDAGWDDYNRILMAIYAATGGADAGSKLAHTWAAKSPKYRAEDVDDRWLHYATSPPTEIGFGSLAYEAQKADPSWSPPSRKPIEMVPAEMAGFLSQTTDLHTSEVQQNQAFTPFVEPDAGVGMNGHSSEAGLFGTAIARKPGNPLIELNEKYSAIGDVGGKCLVLSWIDSKIDEKVKVPSFQSFRSFSEHYGNRYIAVKREGKDGDIIEEAKQLGSYWLKWTGRRTFERIDLQPNLPPVLPGNVLNLWRGMAIEPRPGSWALMQRHVVEVLAAGDVASAHWIFKFAAWAVQNPAGPAEVALVLRGGKGAGKGTFANALCRLFGAHGLHIFNSKHLVGAFNGHLRGCVLLFADEAFWAGDKAGESVLKGMLTEPTIVIEQKGVDPMIWPNYLHVIMSSNSDWVVPASHDERRYVVFNVSDCRRNDRAYFKALHAEMAGGGQAAMLHDLLALDLKGWHPRETIETEGLRQQKERSLGPLDAWWEDALQSGHLPFAQHAEAGYYLPASTAQDLIERFARRQWEVNPTAIGRYLRKVGAVKVHTRNGNLWKMPELRAAREAWDTAFSAWKWEEALEAWR